MSDVEKLTAWQHQLNKIIETLDINGFRYAGGMTWSVNVWRQVRQMLLDLEAGIDEAVQDDIR